MAAHPKDEAYLNAVIPKRIALFEAIKAQQLAQRQSLPHDPIKCVRFDDNALVLAPDLHIELHVVLI